MDEHPSLQVDLLKSEFIIAIVAAFLGRLLILVVCCFWCCKTSHRKKERFERRNSIRMSKSSLGSRSLASVASTGFTDINYRRRIMAQHNKNHSTGTIMSSASYSGTMQGTAQRPSTANANMNPRGVVGSYDSLAKDGLNSTGKLAYFKQWLILLHPHSILTNHMIYHDFNFQLKKISIHHLMHTKGLAVTPQIQWEVHTMLQEPSAVISPRTESILPMEEHSLTCTRFTMPATITTRMVPRTKETITAARSLCKEIWYQTSM